MIYLDNAATTKPKKEVIDAIMPYLTDMWYNPSSLYTPSINVKNKIEKSRRVIADFINASSDEIFFNSGGSEGNSWVIQGFVNKCLRDGNNPVIITSKIEHKSILECVKNVSALVYYVSVNKYGFINIDELEEFLSTFNIPRYKVLVSIQFANNEVGTCQNVGEISKLVHQYNGIFHTDAVQAFGHIPINVKDLDIDLLTASGHKVGALKGIGFLYKKNGIDIKPLIYGMQENQMRGGTENVIGIISLGEAVKHIDFGYNYENIENMIDKRNDFMFSLTIKFDCKLNGDIEYRLPNNINVTFPQNITGEALLLTLDLSRIQISTGSACNSTSIEKSHVLKALGLTDEETMRSVRFTLSEDITYEEIDKVICEIEKALRIINMNEEV